LHRTLRKDLVIDARRLANFVLHQSGVPYPLDSNADIVDGRLELSIPDKAEAPLRTRGDLRFSERRTVRGFADGAWEAVDGFMAALLDALEEGMPDRARR
jgi:hypothetical protein